MGGGISAWRKWNRVSQQEVILMLWPGSITGGQPQLHPEVWTSGGLTRVVKKFSHLLPVHSWPQRKEKLIDEKLETL